MAHGNADNDHIPLPDAHPAHEVRFLVRGLRQLAIDPHAEVPAEFHGTVMAKAQALPLPRKRRQEQVWERLTAWTPVFAVGLLLSLGVHVWQGIRALGPHPSGTHQRAERLLEEHTASGPLSIYQFQVQLQPATALGAVVAARPVPPVPRTLVGFTPHTARPTFVRLGILYADALAALQSGAVEAARHRLDVLTQVVVSLQAPPVLSHYLREMQTVLHRPPPADPMVAQFVALFEPLYASVYATDPTSAAWVLFRTGAWLENLALAAAVGDQAAVRQAPAVQAAHDALRPLHVPDAVLHALAQLRGLVAREPVMAQDLRAIQTLVDTLQQQLGGGAP
jgi:hypothetical protein